MSEEEVMKKTIGTCGNCGGRVTIPDVFWSVVPPEPTCESCSAVARSSLPVIKMEPTSELVWRFKVGTLSKRLRG